MNVKKLVKYNVVGFGSMILVAYGDKHEQAIVKLVLFPAGIPTFDA